MSGNASCDLAVKNLLDSYEKEWVTSVLSTGPNLRALHGLDPSLVPKDQTTLFRDIVPHDEVDFTAPFQDAGLDKIFTGDRLATKMMGNFNCNFLYRNSKEEYDIVVYSTERYLVIQPMGEPGRDLGPGHGSKASHLMIVCHDDGPITFNEMLPSSQDEVTDLRVRLGVMQMAVQKLRDNVPLSQCGTKVVAKAKAMGFNASMGIREFMVTQIKSMPEDKRTGRPGYVLNNSSDMDVAGMGMHAVNSLVDDVFSNVRTHPFLCIQPPSKNTQLLSHIHCFLLDSIPELIDENYVNCEVLLTLKQDKLSAKAMGGGPMCCFDEDGGEKLSRQSSTFR